MSERKLVLYPGDPEAGAESEDLERALRGSDFIGRSIEAVEGRRFRPGPRFVALLHFDPPRSPERYTVAIAEQREEIAFLGGSNTKAPSCSCGTVFHDWSERIDAWRAKGNEWRCDGCGTEGKPWAFDWSHTAGFGRCNVDVHGVDLGDAVPSDALLQELQDVSGSKWDYFYFVE